MNILFARALAASGLEVVHVDPTRAARHRTAQGIPKTDRADARLIASMTLAGQARPIVASSPAAEALRLVAHTHRAAVARRTEALHALRAGLVRIWPAAVSAWPASVGGLRSAQARAVLAAASTPRAAARLDRTALAALLSAAGRKRSVQKRSRASAHDLPPPAMLFAPPGRGRRRSARQPLLAVLDHAVRRADDLERDLERHYADR
ncbi:IS110 family transposase [Streptomyces anulatus]|uniref:IS110 family transposase n=1 Tax=Streptomyces anulatus TaxID=1892 RepID=UPI0033EDFE5E